MGVKAARAGLTTVLAIGLAKSVAFEIHCVLNEAIRDSSPNDNKYWFNIVGNLLLCWIFIARHGQSA
jgi:hypothetical protein